MALKTNKEKALDIIAQQIKVLDDNTLLFAEEGIDVADARQNLFNQIKQAGYQLEAGTYRPVKLLG